MRTKALLLAPALLATVTAAPPAGKHWKHIWGDEFTGKKVDGTKWEKVGDGPRRRAFWMRECAFLDGKGNLIVESKKKGERYLCGGLRSKGRFMHAFGYYEIRCKVPDQVGTWAAFWLYAPCVGKVGNGGRDGAEIDIFEAVWRDRDEINVAIHWDGYGKAHRSHGGAVKAPGVNTGFHTFGLDWTPEEYVFYYDDKEIKRTSAGGVCQVPLYVKVTTEIGKWAGDIRQATLPDSFVVDYVRVYEAVPEPPEPTAWLHRAKWGVMNHYLGSPPSSRGGAELTASAWNEQIDVPIQKNGLIPQAFVDQLAAIGRAVEE